MWFEVCPTFWLNLYYYNIIEKKPKTKTPHLHTDYYSIESEKSLSIHNFNERHSQRIITSDCRKFLDEGISIEDEVYIQVLIECVDSIDNVVEVLLMKNLNAINEYVKYI